MKSALLQCWLFFQRFFDRNPVGLIPSDPWRSVPQSLQEVWSRASLISFPANETGPRKKLFKFNDNRSYLSNVRSFREIQSPGEFTGLREYQPGDDVRQIDWRATARSRQGVVRTWSVESLAELAIIIDVSASMYVAVGPGQFRLIDKAMEIGLLIAAAGLTHQMTVNVILVSDRVEISSGPISGRDKLAGVIELLSQFQPSSRNTNWNELDLQSNLSGAVQWLFWISDYHWLPQPDDFVTTICPYKSHGIKIELPDYDNIKGDLDTDPETGYRIKRYPRKSDLRDRIQEWQNRSGMPVLSMVSNESQPEMQLGTWLRAGIM